MTKAGYFGSSTLLMEEHAAKVQFIVDLLINRKNVLLHGFGGSGKTVAIRRVYSKLQEECIPCSATALTGVAANNITEGDEGVPCKTFHSWAGCGLADTTPEKMYNRIQMIPHMRKRWNSTQVLIIDEISMMGMEVFEKINKLAILMRNCARPFGGLTLLVVGDFLQLPPVKDKWVFKSDAFNEMNWHPVQFKTPFRYTDATYFEMLSRARVGELTEADHAQLEKRVVAYHKFQRAIADMEDRTKILLPTIIYSKNIDVNTYNNCMLEKIDHPSQTYIAVDSFKSKKGSVLDGNDIQILKTMAEEHVPSSVTLKPGAQVMMLKNMDPGLYNGSRGVVVELYPNAVLVQFKQGQILVEAKSWKCKKSKKGKIIRCQIPLKLAWAATVHKSQGQTLDYAEGDMATIFCEGQAYVLLSRVRSFDNLFIKTYNRKKIFCSPVALQFTRELEERDAYEHRNDDHDTL